MDAAFGVNYNRMFPALVVLGISTILNAVYFMKTVLRIYTPAEKMSVNRAQPDVETNTSAVRMGINGVVPEVNKIHFYQEKLYGAVIACFVILNVFLGVFSNEILRLIKMGLEMFA